MQRLPDETPHQFLSRCQLHPELAGLSAEDRTALCNQLWGLASVTAKSACGCHDVQSVKAYTYKLYNTSEESEVDGLVSLNSDLMDVSTDDGEMSAIGILCTNRRDWVGDVVDVGGVVTTEHQSNPIILYDHGKWSPFPVGVSESPDGKYCVWKDVDSQVITQKTFFHNKTAFAVQCYSLVKARVLRANSIAFKDLIVRKLPPEPDAGLPKPGRFIERCAMVEGSWVPAGMNPDAVLTLLGRKKLEGDPLDPVIRKSFEQLGYHLNRPVSVSVPGITQKSIPMEPSNPNRTIDLARDSLDRSMGAAGPSGDMPRARNGVPRNSIPQVNIAGQFSIDGLPDDMQAEYCGHFGDKVVLVVRPRENWDYDNLQLWMGGNTSLQPQEIQVVSRDKKAGVLDIQTAAGKFSFPYPWDKTKPAKWDGNEVLTYPLTANIAELPKQEKSITSKEQKPATVALEGALELTDAEKKHHHFLHVADDGRQTLVTPYRQHRLYVWARSTLAGCGVNHGNKEGDVVRDDGKGKVHEAITAKAADFLTEAESSLTV
jgi:hypothetical protein